MGWQPQDSNLPAQAVFLDSGHEKNGKQHVTAVLREPNGLYGAMGRKGHMVSSSYF
ncbi:hypothetical protein BJ878DRAFT_546970 [Calycina marina]|uniref:Uncharacterized protein n=1 Tax=Calycina marina TaxID=1763456 RepID=A0A9P7YV85_9HELO|nr:hypothetical protein BJ878DRAFT_546970 [Calycina marina]